MPAVLHNLYNELSVHRTKYAVAFVVMGALGSSIVEQRHELFCNNLTPDVTPAMTQAYNDCIQGIRNPLISPANFERSKELRSTVTMVNGAWVLSIFGLGCVVGHGLGRRTNHHRDERKDKERDFEL
jgi:hypothetical protein